MKPPLAVDLLQTLGRNKCILLIGTSFGSWFFTLDCLVQVISGQVLNLSRLFAILIPALVFGWLMALYMWRSRTKTQNKD
jgi:hypothetical protein